MVAKNRISISEKQWQAAVDAFELGTKHASEIALELSVSASTVSREFKRRGCVKACRIAESIAALEAALDAKARREACLRRTQDAANIERVTTINGLIGFMVKSLVEAEKAGSITAAAPIVEKVRRLLAA